MEKIALSIHRASLLTPQKAAQLVSLGDAGSHNFLPCRTTPYLGYLPDNERAPLAAVKQEVAAREGVLPPAAYAQGVPLEARVDLHCSSTGSRVRVRLDRHIFGTHNKWLWLLSLC